MKNEMSRRQFLGFAGSAAAVLGLGLVGCGGSAGSGSSASGDAAEVYFLQFKPEVDKEWKEIAKAYKKEKGVEVKIVTAASNTYEEKLKSEMSKSSAPTLFQVNGPTGLKNWKDYCADLSDTKLRGELMLDLLRARYANDEAHQQFAIAVEWGRYGELFDYDADDDLLSLDEANKGE